LPTEPRTRTWWESPRVLAIAGTLAIHLLVVTIADAMVVLNPPIADPPPPPKLELVDVELPPVQKPPPPPVPEKVPDVPPPPSVVHHVVASHVPAPTTPEPPPTAPPPPDSGGAPVVTEDDIAPSATGVAVAIGKRTTGHIGRGGTGTGTGAGSGAGSADTPPMSVATIKTRAMPKGDYSYEQEKEYPAEAKRLGIEGKIRVKLIVDERGEVKSAALLNHLGHGLDELALKRANAIQFDPAKDTDDHAVTSVVVWTFDLELPK